MKTNISLGYKIYKSKHWVRSTKKKMKEKRRSIERVVQLIYCSDSIGGGWCSATHNKEENTSPISQILQGLLKVSNVFDFFFLFWVERGNIIKTKQESNVFVVLFFIYHFFIFIYSFSLIFFFVDLTQCLLI